MFEAFRLVIIVLEEPQMFLAMFDIVWTCNKGNMIFSMVKCVRKLVIDSLEEALDRPSRFKRCPEGTEVKTSLNHWMLHAIVDENQHFWHSSEPANSPCEHEAYIRESAATARFAMRLSKLSKSRSCAFSSVLNDCTSLRLSILVMQRAKMSMIRFSASVVTRSNAFQVQL